MAKFEEADARWIVKDLGEQGTNVNGWHWAEHDAMEWCKGRLQAVFQGTDILAGSSSGDSLTITEVVCKGEAIINNRKQKLIPAYELDITLRFKGQAGGPDAPVAGRVLLPYVADENHDENPEVRFSSESDDAAAQRLKAAFAATGQKFVHTKIAEFVAELRAGGPCKPGSKAPASSSGAADAAAAAAAAAAAEAKLKLSSAKPEDVKPAAAPASSSAGSKSTLSFKERFYARPSDLYECFVIEGKVRAFTQSPATIEARPGGKFSWFGGSVQGEFEELEADKKIVMKWRFNTWADDCFSKVVVTLDAPEVGTTILKLNQTGIPYEDKFGQPVYDSTESGWKNLILTRIRQVFGYGV